MARAFTAANSDSLTVASALVTAAPLSVAGWFYANNATTNYVLFELSASTTTVDHFRVIITGASGALLRCRAGSVITLGTAASAISYSAATWHHFCAVFTSTTSRTIYLDGGNSGTDTTAVTPLLIDQTNIGRGGGLTPSQYLDGRIAEVGVYNIAMSAEEARALYLRQCPFFVRPGALVNYMPVIIDDDLDLVSGTTWSKTGTPVVADHPDPIYYPTKAPLVVPTGSIREPQLERWS